MVFFFFSLTDIILKFLLFKSKNLFQNVLVLVSRIKSYFCNYSCICFLYEILYFYGYNLKILMKILSPVLQKWQFHKSGHDKAVPFHFQQTSLLPNIWMEKTDFPALEWPVLPYTSLSTRKHCHSNTFCLTFLSVKESLSFQILICISSGLFLQGSPSLSCTLMASLKGLPPLR